MASQRWVSQGEAVGPTALGERIRVETGARVEFVDVTAAAVSLVRRAGIQEGLLCVQTLHTTTAIVVNENEPGLLEDMVEILERLVPAGMGYRHDDLARRVGVPPDEPANGHAHGKAMLLSASQTLTVQAGALQLGRWQRIFLLELDGGRTRTVALTVFGTGPARGRLA
jgi:secondary thiamine-phosphate synthase enzyme